MASIVLTKTLKLAKNSGFTQTNFDKPTLPSGASWTRWKVEPSIGTYSSQKVRNKLGATDLSWNTWYTNMDYLLLSDGTPRLYFNNTSGQYAEYTATLTMEYTNPYTPVTAGNKILATDRSQTGTTTTVGSVMTDSHFSSGTKIEASTFNSQVLGL